MKALSLLLLLNTIGLLLLTPGCWSLSIDRIGLMDNQTYATIQSDGPTVLGCWYTLDEGEVLEEIVWSKGGRMLQRTTESNGSVNQYPLTSLSRSDAGRYLCSARTKAGESDKENFELLVTDIPEREYSGSSHKTDCYYNITYKTPAAYPKMTAFCGIWVNEEDDDGEKGYWLEAPPEREPSPDPSYDDETPAARVRQRSLEPKLSYSTERGEFRQTSYENQYTKFELIDAIIQVNATPVNSHVKCFTGFYKNSGDFIPQSSVLDKDPDSFVKNKCPATTLTHYTSADVQLEYSDHRITCRNLVAPLQQTGELQATLRCSKTADTAVVECHGNDWVIRSPDGTLLKDIEHHLEKFEEQCDHAEGSDQGNHGNHDHDDDDDDDGSASFAPSSSVIVASTVLIFVLQARR